MYEDRLDGRIDVATFDQKATEWRAEQDRIQRSLDEHRAADRAYVEIGVRLLELASRAHGLFIKQVPSEKRRLLNFLVSNSTWKDGTLTVTFRQPFALLMDTNISFQRDVAAIGPEKAEKKNWPAFVDTFRTLLVAPTLELTSMLERAGDFVEAA